MKILWVFTSSALVFGCAKDKGPAPFQGDSTIAASSSPRSRVELAISEPMRLALNQFAPTFEPFSPEEYSPEILADSGFSKSQPPYEAKGDFNGDGLPDLALNGHDKSRELLIVLLSQRDSSYKVYALKEIGRQPVYNHDVGISLAAFKPGPLHISEAPPGAPRHPDSLPNGGVMINHGDAASEIFYWNGSRFIQFFTGD